MAPPRSDKNVPPIQFEVPEGWVLVTKPKKRGKLAKYYTNIQGQKFYTEADLMKYIQYSKERGFSIYDPGFKPPTTGPFAMPSRLKVEAASTSTGKHNSINKVLVKSEAQNEAESDCGAQEEDEFQYAMALLKISGQDQSGAKEIKESHHDSYHDIECAIALLNLSIGDQNEVQIPERESGC